MRTTKRNNIDLGGKPIAHNKKGARAPTYRGLLIAGITIVRARDNDALEAFKLILSLGSKNTRRDKRAKSCLFTWVDVNTYVRGLSHEEALKEVVMCT